MSTGDIFKKFTLECVAQIACSSQKDQMEVRNTLKEEYPCLEEYWEDILPKKKDIFIIRCRGQIHCITLKSQKPEVLFFNIHDGPYFPHLKLLQKYPFMLPMHQVDIGGCKHIVSGADAMCPGLLTEGGHVSPDVPKGTCVGIFIEGKLHPVAVGTTLMSSEEIVKKAEGPCIQNVHHLGDGLWMNSVLSDSLLNVKGE